MPLVSSRRLQAPAARTLCCGGSRRTWPFSRRSKARTSMTRCLWRASALLSSLAMAGRKGILSARSTRGWGMSRFVSTAAAAAARRV
uniref:Uncharacterized protein n=1 Tax=Triticum urartu TaxID=4572 RepID=A0A8R7Q768_TRIUA